jgi:hypothetical protein
MDRLTASYRAVGPMTPPPRGLAALGPKMLALAAERAQGHTRTSCHPSTPPRHQSGSATAAGYCRNRRRSRDESGQPRAIARAARCALPRPAQLHQQPASARFTDDDLAAGGSDRLVDALFAWGDIARIARRVRDHHDAGADHVCIQVFDANPYGLPMRQWKELAAALL